MKEPDDRRKTIWLAITLAAVAIAGILGAWFFAQQTNREQEEILLHQARAIALATNPERIKKLTAAPSDLTEPAYLRLKGYYELLKKSHPDCHSIALIGRHASSPFFYYLNSESKDSPEGIQPGSPLEKAPKSYFHAYRSNVPVIAKPVPSGGKRWLSAVVPVNDPVTTKPIALLEFTVDAQSVHAKIIKAALPPLLVTLSVVAVLGAATHLIRRRSRQANAPRWLWFLEPVAVIIIGIQITLFWAWMAHETENRNRNRAFENLAESKTATFSESLQYLRDSGLQGLASYFRSCAVVTRDGFQAYASYLTDARRFQAWDWVPAIAAEEKEKFEQQIREQDDPEFQIWQNDARKIREPASGRDTYYPVLHPAPKEGNERAVGFDLGSEPLRRATLEEAVRFRFATASEPLDLVIDNKPQRGLIVLQPVFANNEPNRLRGFAMAVLKIETALENTHPDPTVSIEWAFLQKDGTAKPVAANLPHTQPASSREYSYTVPIMAFGKVMQLTAHPGPEFDANHPRRAGWLTLGVGLLFTFLLAIRAYTIVRKREELEQLVVQRTAALAASEARHRAMFEKNRSIELLINPKDGQIVDANPAACEFYGYLREAMRKMNIAQINILPPGRILDEMEQARSGLYAGFHFRHVLANGEIRDVEVHSSPILVDNRELLYSIIHDITQRMEAERALLESETNFRIFFESITDLVAVISPEGRILCANPSLETALGYSGNELTRMHYRDLHARAPQSDADALLAAILRNEQTTCPLPMKTKGGDLVPVETRICQGHWNGAPALISLSKDISAEQAARQRFERLFQNNPSLLGLLSLPDRKFVDVNRAFTEALGYSRDEVIGKTPEELKLYLDPSSGNKIDTEIHAKGHVIDVEIQTRRKDGTVVDVLYSGETFVSQGQHYILGVGVDITERKQAEQERQTMLQRFFTILSGMYSGVCLETREGIVEFVNEAFCANLNITQKPAQLIGLSTQQMLAALRDAYIDPEQSLARTREIIQENQPIKGEELAIANGRTLQWDFIPLTIEGQSHGRMWLLFDITKRKQIEEELKRQANLINSLFNAIPEIIFSKDINGAYLSCNSPFLEFVGKTRDEVIGRTDYELFERDLADHFRKHDAQAMASSQPIHIEEWVPYPDGTWELVETIKTPLREPAGEILGIVGTSHTITERRRAEDALREAKDAAEAANRAKSDFLANMSHEIRTPMNAILGFAHLMQEDNAVPEHQKQHLQIITRSGNFLLSLINDILEMSKIEAGRTTLVPVPFDLHALLTDLERIFLPQIEARHLRLIPPDLAEIPRHVIGDERKLRQILFNLLGNAVKFTFTGWIALRAHAVETGNHALRLDIEVEDTGIGISQSDQSQLFQRFIQTESGRQVGGGTGLGLAITRAFVEIMGGKISVSSEVRKGSTFRFHVHLEKAEATDEPAPHPAKALRLRPGQPPVRVLLADNLEENRCLLRQLLAPVGFELKEAVNGSEAVALFDTWAPHLILMDARMPLLDGAEAVKRIRASGPRGAEVKIIVNSASVLEDHQREALAAGADAFLAKPINHEELLRAIHTLLKADFIIECPEAPRTVTSGPISEAGLSADWIAAMREAVEAADYQQVENLIESIAATNPLRAQQLLALADRFDADRLLGFLDSAARQTT